VATPRPRSIRRPLVADAEWMPVPGFAGPAVYRGREGFVEFMRTWTEDFEDWSIRLERLIDAGNDRVVALLHQWATGKGSGVPVEFALEAIQADRSSSSEGPDVIGVVIDLEAAATARRDAMDPHNDAISSLTVVRALHANVVPALQETPHVVGQRAQPVMRFRGGVGKDPHCMGVDIELSDQLPTAQRS
jgi:hypothetical protein